MRPIGVQNSSVRHTTDVLLPLYPRSKLLSVASGRDLPSIQVEEAQQDFRVDEVMTRSENSVRL